MPVGTYAAATAGLDCGRGMIYASSRPWDRPLLSEVLRHSTEQRWADDPRLNDAGDGPARDDFCPHDDHHHHGDDQGINDDPNQDGGEEWV